MSEQTKDDKKTRKMKRAEKKRDGIPFWKLLAWSTRGGSTGIASMIIGYLTIFCTDTLGVPPATVGFLLLASKLIDGITDLFAGYLVDGTRTKLGKGRPYELCIIGLWAATVGLFCCPEQYSLAMKCVWILVMYGLANSIFLTFLNANGTVYMVRAFSTQKQYVALSTYGGVVPMLMTLIYNVIFPVLMGKMATSQKGWIQLILIFAVPLTLIGLLRFVFIPETRDVDVESHGDKVKMRDVFRVLRRNPYIYIVAFASLIMNVITNMGVNVYYFTHIVGNVGMMGVLAAAQVVILPMMFVLPQILKKVSVAKVIRVGLLVVSVGYLVNYFAGSNLGLLIAGALLTGAGVVPMSMLTGLLIIDLAEYNEYRGMRRLEGSLSAVNGFAKKVGAGIGSGILGIIIGLAGYDGTLAVQPDSALTMIRLLYSLIPMVLYLGVYLAYRFYRLDRDIDEIRRVNEENRKKYVTGEHAEEKDSSTAG